MMCPECQFDNRERAQFCSECGHKLELCCPDCGISINEGSKFCDGCGYKLGANKRSLDTVSETGTSPDDVATDVEPKEFSPIDSERKHVTVLFSDLTGYTAMSEKLDPEEVKEITSRIFSEISKIVAKYDGFIEKYAGDAVLAIFGVPKAHEDDAIRALKVAREIHELVDGISPEVENSIGQPILLHTGINTGLVVTGEVDLERGTHGVAGDTVNLASRLSNLAKPGEILIDTDTCRQAEGHFACKYLEETTIKGKADPIKVHKVLSPRDKTVTIHRLSGLRADLVGRKAELTELSEAVKNLKKGRGKIFSICGAAGTGKSRLVDEFKATLDLDQIQWLEGHAFSFAHNIPYFQLINFLNNLFQIKEGDPLEKVRSKIDSGIGGIVGKNEEIVAYIGNLYALSYSITKKISPELWKSKLQKSIKIILTAIAQKSATIFCLEDLHWADPSFIELLRNCLLDIRQPAIVLCIYRPTFTLFTSQQISTIAKTYEEIHLLDLSPSEAQDMLESLLKSQTVPTDLKKFVQEKTEGNPFYLEELVNSLIESSTLIQENGSWILDKSLTESEISLTINGVIASRLDRLEDETKRILQDASVIGRTFLYEILKQITENNLQIDGSLRALERFNLIRERSSMPELEYFFKHALTQEVAYSSLLKKRRRVIHEKIGFVIENLFQDRLPEFYETLALHFKNGQIIDKAIDYQIKSGIKSWKRCANEEAHQYFKEAFELLNNKSDITKEDSNKTIDLLLKWAYIFSHRGDYGTLYKLLKDHESLAESLDDKEIRGMYNGWLGFTLNRRERLNESYNYLLRALEFGEEIESRHVIAYSCAWLSYTCSDLGLMNQAIDFGNRAKELSKLFESDLQLFRFTMFGLGLTYYYSGDSLETRSVGEILLNNGKKLADNRSLTLGHMVNGFSFMVSGNISSANECFKHAIRVSVDPLYTYTATFFLGLGFFSTGELEGAQINFEQARIFGEKLGLETIGTPAKLMLSFLFLSRGSLSDGVKIANKTIKTLIENGSKYRYAAAELFLGKLYLRLVLKDGPVNFSLLVKNIGFFGANLPFARKIAEDHLSKAIMTAREIGAKSILGQSLIELSHLHKAKKKCNQARQCILEAIDIFQECEAEVYLKQANEALDSYV